MIDGMPDGALVSLQVETVRVWLDEDGPGFEPDLTVGEVAQHFDRSPQTVRTWIRDGRLVAYRFQNKEYRVTRGALADFQERERHQ